MGEIYKKRYSDSFYKKKGQFTIFVILALIILFIFAFALYARVKIINAQAGSQADTLLKNYITNNAINQYVVSCIDAVADDVILTTAMQGGVHSDSDTGSGNYIEYYYPGLDRTFNVTIAIDANYGCPDNRPEAEYIVTQIHGFYPYNCADEYVDKLPKIYSQVYGNTPCKNNCTDKDFRKYSGFFGINNLSMLCDKNGANAPGIAPGDNSRSCDYYENYPSEYRMSLQHQMEEEINKGVKTCVNFTDILKRSPSNITSVGEPNTTIQFYKGGLGVTVKYPFTITLRNKQPVTRFVDFGTEKDIPFKELYEYTYELANHDVKNATFNVVRDKEKVVSNGFNIARRNNRIYQSNFMITIIEGNESNGFTNILQVTDTEHDILGVPLTINIGIRNRRPVLDYIHNGQSAKYDIAAVENRTMILSPQGYDPDDEQSLTYAYGGWLEEYDDYYNWSDYNCSNPQTFEYILENCTKRNYSSIPGNNWTRSELFTSTHKNASYSTLHSDVGFHTVKVAVFDRNGLDDFQNVRILVFDLPVARINGSNGYDDINNSRASFEDIYTLDGSESSVGAIASTLGISFTSFMWNDSIEPVNVTKNIFGEQPLTRKLILPNDTINIDIGQNIIHTFDINNIVLFAFKSRTLPNDAPYTVHNITLTVTTQNGLSNKNSFYVNVTQCLNHSSTTPSYPYDTLPPYNIMPEDTAGHLMADHACCADTLTYKTADEQCFNSDKYGMNISLMDFTQTVEPPKENEYTINYALSSDDYNTKFDNDILHQIFSRYCSGDRGNICTGLANETRTNADEEFDGKCDDTNGLGNTVDAAAAEKFEDERCSGPPENMFAYNKSVDTNPGCINYSAGTTFESLMNERFEAGGSGANGASPADGICTTEKQCSDGNVFKIYDSTIDAFYSCSGECSGDGKCNAPAYSSCVCDSSCGTSDKECDGLGGSGYPAVQTCRGDKPYFADRCDDCKLIDANNICIYDSSNKDNGCTASSVQCNNVRANTALASNPLGNSGCNLTCQYIDCGFFKYSPSASSSNGGCPSTCSQNSQCIQGYFCNITAMPQATCQNINSVSCFNTATGLNDNNICRITLRLGSTYSCVNGRCEQN